MKVADFGTIEKKTTTEIHGYEFGCDGVVSFENALVLLDLSKDTLYRRIHDGFIRSGKDGGRRVICRKSINDYLKNCED